MDESFMQILGHSAPISRLRECIRRVAPTEARVLVLGENGTGKELVAHAIHAGSKRRGGPFVILNCAALSESLMESELFGHEKGSFTGAYEKRLGRFELANGGTLFLDEVGDMPLSMQAKLLRVLQQGSFERVGGKAPIRVDVRVICATNKALRTEVKAGRFREDLYHRIAVIPIKTPPLRERKEDLGLLASAFAARVGRRMTLSPSAVRALTTYGWPGNVRELGNVVERMAALSDAVEVTDVDVVNALALDAYDGPSVVALALETPSAPIVTPEVAVATPNVEVAESASTPIEEEEEAVAVDAAPEAASAPEALPEVAPLSEAVREQQRRAKISEGQRQRWQKRHQEKMRRALAEAAAAQTSSTPPPLPAAAPVVEAPPTSMPPSPPPPAPMAVADAEFALDDVLLHLPTGRKGTVYEACAGLSFVHVLGSAPDGGALLEEGWESCDVVKSTLTPNDVWRPSAT